MDSFLSALTLSLILVFSACSFENSESEKSNSKDLPAAEQDKNNVRVFDSDTEPLYSIGFTADKKYGEFYPSSAPLPPTRGLSGKETAIDNYGNVYRADRAARTIYVYSSEGNKTGQAGRKGRGPGEFVEISSIAVKDNRLFVYDSNLIRISIFDLNPVKLYKTVKLEMQSFAGGTGLSNAFPAAVLPLNGEEFLMGMKQKNAEGDLLVGYYKMNLHGELISEKIFEQKLKSNHTGKASDGNTIGLKLPFGTEELVAVYDSTAIYHVNNQKLFIKTYAVSGGYQGAIYYPFDHAPLDKEEVLNKYSPYVKSAVKSADFPEVWPALDKMLVDDKNRIWLSTIVDNERINTWRVLSNEGELLAVYDWPANESIEAVQGGKMYVKKTDEESGAYVLNSYAVQMD